MIFHQWKFTFRVADWLWLKWEPFFITAILWVNLSTYIVNILPPQKSKGGMRLSQKCLRGRLIIILNTRCYLELGTRLESNPESSIAERKIRAREGDTQEDWGSACQRGPWKSDKKQNKTKKQARTKQYLSHYDFLWFLFWKVVFTKFQLILIRVNLHYLNFIEG